MCVYLIHMFGLLGSDKHSANHYLGYATDVTERLRLHRAGLGARMLEVAAERGIRFEVVRIWQGGDRKLERRLKDRGHACELCPVCSGAAAFRRAVVTPHDQLTFNLEEMPDGPALKMDWLEIQMEREFRQARGRPVIDLAAIDACL